MASKRIENLKTKLRSGVSQQEAEQIRQQILSLGGKVNLASMGYGKSSLNDPVARMTNDAKPIKNPGSVYEADVAAEDAESGKQINYQNPNVTTAFGSSETKVNPDGTVSVNQNLSPEQQKILNSGQSLTQAGQARAGQMLGGYQQFNAGDYNRNSIEDAVYQRLMRGTEGNRERDMEAKKQELYNKGIPYSADPNSRYQQEVNDINRRYDEQELQAKSQATIQGAGEQQNAFNQGLTTHQQYLSDIGTLQGQGTGLMLPQFQAYQGPNYDVNDPSTYIYAGKELKQGNKALQQNQQQIDQQNAIANKQLAIAASNAGGTGAPAAPSFP